MKPANSLKSPKVVIHTHGCKLNQADSQVLAQEFQQAGFTVVRTAAQADVVVLNSCTVTANSDSKARQYLRRARRNNPDALVVATGCYAQRAKDELSVMESASLILDNRDKPTLVSTVAAKLNIATDHPVQKQPEAALGRSRAMVKIQEGCDQVCAYCIVPKVRGRERKFRSCSRGGPHAGSALAEFGPLATSPSPASSIKGICNT